MCLMVRSVRVRNMTDFEVEGEKQHKLHGGQRELQRLCMGVYG